MKRYHHGNLTVTDEYGNTDDCTFEVNTIDNTAPSITTCAADTSVIMDASCSYTLPDFTSDADLCGHRMQHL